jgi:ketosteroid isomerase-like protein
MRRQAFDDSQRKESFMTISNKSTTDIVTAAYKAYADKDRAMIEKLISQDLRFTSPLDEGIDRAVYFERCWPNSDAMVRHEIQRIHVDGEAAFVTYECLMKDGRRFRNTELLTTRGGQVTSVEVYFGWDTPRVAVITKSHGNGNQHQLKG